MSEERFVRTTANISFDLPSSVHRSIAKTIIAFSYLETTAEMMIWDILKLQPDDGRIFTRNMAANRKFKVLKDLLKPRHNKDTQELTKDPFWDSLEEAANSRNAIAHAAWIWVDGSKPMVVSMRWQEKDLPNSITAEHYPIERMTEIANISATLDTILRRIISSLGLRQPPFEQPPRGS